MSGRPYIKFFTSDWLGDVKLQACSLAARGLWIQLICLMHETKPYGHLLIDGKPPTSYRISQLVHADPRLVKKLMAELKNADVLASNPASNPASEIASRRMVRDKLKSQQGQKFSELRWGEKTAELPIAPLPDRKKERSRPKESKGRKPNPRHRWENDLLKQLGPDGYADALDVLAANPELVDRATRAERRRHGSGVMAAMLGLRQLNGGTP